MLHTLAWIGTDCRDTLCEIQTGAAVLIAISIPFIFFGAIAFILGRSIFKYIQSRKADRQIEAKGYRHQIIIIVSIIIGLGVISFGQSVFYQLRREQNQNRIDFTVYALPGQTVNTEHIRNKSGLTIPHTISYIESPRGKISVTQALFDTTIQNVFKVPDECDTDMLFQYLSTWGNDKVPTDSFTCVIVRDDEWRVLAPLNAAKQKNTVPYIAQRGSTFMLFHAFGSSQGEFDGTPPEALPYINKFLDSVEAMNVN